MAVKGASIGRFVQDAPWQGLKPDLFLLVYGPTESRALIQNQNATSETSFSR